MNRNYYCKVNSQKEADELLKKLRDIGETTNNKYIYITNWQYIVYNNTTWALSNIKIFKEEFEDKIEVSASELIDYVTGKKLDRYTLLKEARRRYPVGTKFRCPAGIGVTGIHKIEIEDEIEFYGIYSNNIDISGKGYIYYNNQWAEIVEEPKVETKFEKGKWYKILDNWYGKFETVHNSGKRIKFSEYITSNGTYMYSTNNIDFISEIKPLINLQEIQQYLPDGHPDKFTTPIAKEEFVLPEKWCIKSTDEADETLIKWRGGTYANRPAYLCSDKYWISENIYKAYTEITFDQFKKYVLKQKVKEEVKSMEEWSIGSYVVFLKDYGGHPKGTIDTIKSTTDEYISVENCLFNGGSSTCNLYRNSECKWFQTLQEAQKFSDELLGKSKASSDRGNLMESREYPEYYECIKGDEEDFITGKIYKINNPKNLEAPANFIDEKGREDGWCGNNFEHFKPSTKSAYDAQFKKSEQFKNGDWLVYIKRCASIPIKIGDIKQMIKGKFGSLVIYGYEDLSQYFRKALPHEIPVENSVKQYPYTPEESIKLDFKIKWNSGRYFIGVDPVSDLKTTLSIDDEDLPMVIPSKEVKITNKLSID